jgi:hypothetical protein
MSNTTTDQLIKDLLARNAFLEDKIERLYWKNRNQKLEIRRLNQAHIGKNNIIRSRENQLESLKVNTISESVHS